MYIVQLVPRLLSNQPAKSYYLGIIVKMRTSTWRRLRFRSIQIHPTMFFQKKIIHSLKMPSKKDKILYHYQILTTCFSILGYMKLTIHNKKQKILKKVQKYFFIFPLIDYCCIVHSKIQKWFKSYINTLNLRASLQKMPKIILIQKTVWALEFLTNKSNQQRVLINSYYHLMMEFI